MTVGPDPFSWKMGLSVDKASATQSRRAADPAEFRHQMVEPMCAGRPLLDAGGGAVFPKGIREIQSRRARHPRRSCEVGGPRVPHEPQTYRQVNAYRPPSNWSATGLPPPCARPSARKGEYRLLDRHPFQSQVDARITARNAINGSTTSNNCTRPWTTCYPATMRGVRGSRF